MPHPHRLTWAGIDPDRLDTAVVSREGARFDARGASVSDEHALMYALRVGPDLVTESLAVRTTTADGEHRLELVRAADGAWTARHDDGSPTTLDLLDVLDCDLSQCLLTKTMPILRHDLVETAKHGGGPPVDLRMALVSVPDLDVTLSRQRYSPLAPTANGGAQIRFDSDDFAATLEVDANGFIVDYPGLGQRRMLHPTP